jgi:dimeric dUTPase (all-alpha-NTP-PPase superfamily)
MEKFNKIEDLKQIKSDKELTDKCNEIIDSLSDFTKNEKFRILTTLYDSFMDICKNEGINFIEVNKLG